jgi:hypothetical protein
MSANELIFEDVELRLFGTKLDDYQSFGFEIDGEQIDTTNVNSAKFKDFIDGKADMNINVAGNFNAASGNNVLDVIASWIAEDTIAYEIRYKTAAVGQRETISGNCFVTGGDLQMNDGEDVKWTTTFAAMAAPAVGNKAGGG